MFIHIDIDCFFASAQRSVDPALKGIPMCVGSRSNLEIFDKKRNHTRLMDENSGAFVAPVFYNDKERDFKSYFVDEINGVEKIRGIVTTSSYEARAFGVKTAMPISHALKLCPQMIVVPSDYPLYHRLSHEIHDYLASMIPRMEQFSIDEFFGDLSGWKSEDEAYDYAVYLQEQLLAKFDIPVSIGISRAKWIAKLATESAKPYGVYEVKDIAKYIENMPIAKFPGIGRGFQEKLGKRYISTLGELSRNRELLESWGKSGKQIYARVTGTCKEEINTKSQRKSIGISRTFDPEGDSDEIRRRVMIMARHISYIVQKLGVNPTSFYLGIRYEYGSKVKKSITQNRLFSENLYKRNLIEMYDEIALETKRAVKLTLNTTNFSSQHNKTLSLLDLDDDMHQQELGEKIQKLRSKFGLDIIKSASEL